MIEESLHGLREVERNILVDVVRPEAGRRYSRRGQGASRQQKAYVRPPRPEGCQEREDGVRLAHARRVDPDQAAIRAGDAGLPETLAATCPILFSPSCPRAEPEGGGWLRKPCQSFVGLVQHTRGNGWSVSPDRRR